MRRPDIFILILMATLAPAAGCGGDKQGAADVVDTSVAPDTEVAADTGVAPDTEVAADTAVPLDTEVATDTAVGPTESTCVAPVTAAVANASVPAGFCANTWATGLSAPRGIIVAPSGEVVVVERDKARVTALWDDDGDGVSGAGERGTLASASGLNHGVAIAGGFLYASSSTTVFRWAYTAGDRADLGASTVVVKGIPSGGHATRTVRVDDAGRLYVSVGSASNLDSDSSRARVRRFDLGQLPAGGFAFGAGEVFADGLRNEVGLTWDPQGRLWGVQNGVDQLNRADLGGDIHDDNPAEILSLFDTPGAFHGYPWCWTEFKLPNGVGLGAGTMWAHPSTMNDGTHTDAWCRDTAHVNPPALAMQAHSAPLGLTFYEGAAFPADYVGDAFVAFHGSWNRDTPTGYKVVRVHFAGGAPTSLEPFLEYSGAGDIAASWPHRPVDVAVAADGRLLVTSDSSGVVLSVGYDPGR